MTPGGEKSELRDQITRNEARIVELEIESAFRRQTVESLDEVIRGQDHRIDALEHRLAELLAQLAPVADD